MTEGGASTIHDNLIEAVQSHDTEHVAIQDEIGVVLNFLGRAFNEIQTLGLPQEFDIGLLHVLRHMCAKDGHVRVFAETSQETLGRFVGRLERLGHVVTELEDFDASEVGICLSFERRSLELESVIP